MTLYCTGADVNLLLRNTLSDDQLALADIIAPAATAYIDATTGRTWQGDPVIDEYHSATGALRPDAWLFGTPWWGDEDIELNSPFASIISVYSKFGASTFPLDYEIIDPAQGRIRARGTWYGRDVYVSYLPAATPPEDIKLAARFITMHWLQPGMHPERVGLDQFQIGDRELAVKMAAEKGIPAEGAAILKNYTRWVFA